MGTEFEIIYSVYENDDNASNLLATATRSVIIVADTSEEDDSSPDNGDTQTTEENIMSKFTFSGDLVGTYTHERDLSREERLADIARIKQMVMDEKASLMAGPDGLTAGEADATEIAIPVVMMGQQIFWGLTSQDAVAIKVLFADGSEIFYDEAPADWDADGTASLIFSKKIGDLLEWFTPERYGSFASTNEGETFQQISFQGERVSSIDAMDPRLIKQFLHNLKLRGIDSCADIVVHDDIIMKSGDNTFSGTSLIKDVELAFGISYIDDNGNEIWLQGNHLNQTVHYHGVMTEALGTGGFAGDASVDFTKTAGQSDVFEGGFPGDSGYGSLTIKAESHMTPEGQMKDFFELFNEDWSTFLGTNTLGALFADTKWYLRLIKADGSVELTEFTAVNDLVQEAGSLNSGTLSILAGMSSVRDLRDAARYMLSELGFARVEDVNVLELKIDNDLLVLMQHLNDAEQQMAAFIKAEDENIFTFTKERANELLEDWHDVRDAIRLTTGSVIPAVSGQHYEVFFPVLGDSSTLLEATDIHCWHFDISVHDSNSGARRGDVEVLYEIERGPGKLLFTPFFDDCADENQLDGHVFAINAIYTGDVSDLIDRNRESVSRNVASDPTITLALNADGTARKIDDTLTTV